MTTIASPFALSVLPYDSQRTPEIVDLLNISLGERLSGSRDDAYWQWKHELNPFGQSIMLLGEADGKLVGLRAFMRWRLRNGNQSVEAAKPVDSVTHPDYQRRGIFSRLTRDACEAAAGQQIELIFNTPNSNSEPGYLKLGWQRVGQLPLWIKLLRPVSTCWSLMRWKAGKRTLPTEADFFRHEPVAAKELLNNAVDLEPLLVEDPSGRESIQTDRTTALLRWRYAQHPNINYYTETVSSNQRLEGAMFYRTSFRLGLREIMIDDIVTGGDRKLIVAELMRKLKRRVAAEYAVAHIAEHSELCRHIRRTGFYKLPNRAISLVANKIGTSLSLNPFDLKHWSLCLGDLEGL